MAAVAGRSTGSLDIAMLTRKVRSQPKETDWFFFSSGMIIRVSSDYIAMRLLHQLEPLTCAPTICVSMIDVAEKSLKLHLAVQTRTTTALSDMATTYGHNLEALRAACARYTPVFDDVDVRSFTSHLNDRDGKLYQELRYGAQKTTDGFSTNLSTLRPVVDKIFAESILGLPEEQRRLLVSASPLKSLLVRSRFDQTKHPHEVIDAVRRDNAYFERLSTYCHRLEEDQDGVLKALAEAKGKGDV
jgi:hypothetical protein